MLNVVIENKVNIISALRADILRLEGFRSNHASDRPHISNPILRSFPGAVFPTGCTHEFLLSSIENFSATGAFISTIISSLLNTTGAIVWISRNQKIFPTGLESFGIPPERFVFVTVKLEKDLLWVTEEALKSASIGAVVCEVNEISFKVSRRLQLAVEQSRTTGFIIRLDKSKLSTTACVSRWRVTQLPSDRIDDLPGLGFPKWKVELLRVRNGRQGVWNFHWSERQLTCLTLDHSTEFKSLQAG